MFFFDEAHLLFAEAPKALIEKVEQVVKLIRSKGVGVYFVTQNPMDIPESVLAQLGNRVQHALRAYTPREQRAVETAADTFRPNPEFKVSDAITKLGVGEALVSTLGPGGVPSIVERTLIRPPSSRLGPIADSERRALIAASPVGIKYDNVARSRIRLRGPEEARGAERHRRRSAAHRKRTRSRSRRGTISRRSSQRAREPEEAAAACSAKSSAAAIRGARASRRRR